MRTRAFEQQNGYDYRNYLSNSGPAKIRILPGIAYVREYSHPSFAKIMVDEFMDSSLDQNTRSNLDDIFQQKLETSKDGIDLILYEIQERERLMYENINVLYEDLFKIDQWRAQRPFPDNYRKDKIWSDLNRMELNIKEQLRRELKDTAKHTSFSLKDLRNSLLGYKKQKLKSNMMQETMDLEGLEEKLDPANVYKYSGDIYR